jgi:hypothetical protein
MTILVLGVVYDIGFTMLYHMNGKNASDMILVAVIEW